MFQLSENAQKKYEAEVRRGVTWGQRSMTLNLGYDKMQNLLQKFLILCKLWSFSNSTSVLV